VVSTPLKNIGQLGLIFPIYGKIKTVPNHQPELFRLGHFSVKINGFFFDPLGMEKGPGSEPGHGVPAKAS